MNNINYIIKLLNIQDKYINIYNIEFINNTYLIYAEQLQSEDNSCPKCGGILLTKNNDNIRKIKHTPINGYPCIINFKQLRFKCIYCGKSFNQDTSLIGKGRNISNFAKETIIKETHYKQSFKDISKRSNVSQTTISNEFKKNIHNFRCKLTRIICIDEFKANTIAGKYALIIGDPELGDILDVLKSRLQDYIYHYFNTIDKDKIKKV